MLKLDSSAQSRKSSIVEMKFSPQPLLAATTLLRAFLRGEALRALIKSVGVFLTEIFFKVA
jgi:hypothetical protein